MPLSELLNYLMDKPIDFHDQRYLVNREREIESLNKIALYQPFGIYGVAGETGIGKSTVLNFVRAKDVFIRMINISLRESMESILYDLVYNLSKSLEDEPKISQKAKEIANRLSEEVSIIKGFSLGFSMVASANFNIQKNQIPRFNFYAAKESLRELIQLVTNVKGKFALIVDELDKEKKEDVLRILDSLKKELIFDNFVVILSLPYSIYREYGLDRLRWNESGNLENIFKDIVFLSPLNKSDIKELLVKRLSNYIEIIQNDVFDIAADFSDGNPRDAIWIMNKTVFENVNETKLERKHILSTIDKIIKEYYADQLFLTDNQKLALDRLRNFEGPRDKAVEVLRDSGMKRTTAYSIIEQLLNKKILIKRNSLIMMSGKFRYIKNA